MKTYITIKENYQHELIIKKSRFITHLARVQTPEAAQDFITSIKKQEYKANHNCSAFIVGDHNQFQHANDNGEPAGTAGVPMLETLQQMQVQNVVAVVTRYFGGIKLGSGGLIRAYRQSVSQAINAVGRVQGIQQQELLVTIAYNKLDSLMYWLQQQHLVIANTSYTDQVILTILVNKNQIEQTKKDLNNLLNAQIQMELGNTTFNEIPLV
ncbi:MAG: YigZ family protein [Lactobacillus sp.]|nr:YigZ family protein [Lactobacillus sp.]